MAQKPSRAAAENAKAKKPAAPAKAAKKPEPARPAKAESKPAPKAEVAMPKNGASKVQKPSNGKPAVPKSRADALADLAARATANEQGATVLRSDPLQDAQAARQVVEFASGHAAELSRRGLSAAYGEAALALATEIEDHLKALPAAATTVRARSAEANELIADAAALVGPARDAIQRVTRTADGRRAAHAFGIGEQYSARQPHLVLRALRRVVDASAEYPQIAFDAGILADDVRAMGELAEELAGLSGSGNGNEDAVALHAAHGALRAYFDLVAAKGTIAFAADPDERVRLLALLPRGQERRHLRRAAEAPAA